MSDYVEPDEILILERIQELLESRVIKDADNESGGTFCNTLLNRVHIGRTIFDDQDKLPLVSILEVPLPDDQRTPSFRSGFGNLSGKWDLVVQGWARDERNPSDRIHNRNVYRLRQDVHCALSIERAKLRIALDRPPLFGIRRIKDFIFDRGVVRPDDDRSDTSFFWFPLTIDLG